VTRGQLAVWGPLAKVAMDREVTMVKHEVKLSVIEHPWSTFHPVVTWFASLEDAQKHHKRAIDNGAYEVTLTVRKRDNARDA
jgi:hypothetical protein